MIWLTVGALVAFVLLYKLLFNPSLNRKVAVAANTKDIAPVQQALNQMSATMQPVAFSSAIQQLWEKYERELAMPLIKDLAEAHPDTKVSQYWLDQAQKVEPELANEHLGADFLRGHYQPEVAASCGKFG